MIASITVVAIYRKNETKINWSRSQYRVSSVELILIESDLVHSEIDVNVSKC